MRRKFTAMAGLAAWLGAAMPVAVQAQITVDGTLSPAHALVGPNYAITPDLGRQLGSNLFHSFGLFNLNTGESATFSGPNSVANIIARVTGGSVSLIDGTIASSIPGANLFLINPAGLVFGPNAQLQVSGAFHAATAHYLRFGDGATFSATTPSGSGLTTAAPQAFGFLAGNPSAIAVYGSTLSVSPGAQLSLIGGAGGVAIDGATVAAPSGVVHIASIAGPGEIGIDPTDQASLTATHFGPVSVTDDAVVDTSGAPAGAIFIRGGTVTVDFSSVTNEHSGAAPGGGITIIGAESISITDFTIVEAQNGGSGTMGPVTLQGGSVAVTGGSSAFSVALGTGPGAPVVVSGSDISITGGSVVGSITTTGAPSGAITVTASGSLIVDGSGSSSATGIASLVVPGAAGNAGTVTVAAGSALQVSAGGAIGSETGGTGDAGSISVTAGSISLDASTSVTNNLLAGGIFSVVDGLPGGVFLGAPMVPASGNGGTITVVSPGAIVITGGAVISGATFGAGAAGDVMVHGGTILIDPGESVNLTGISANGATGSTGAGGNIIAIADTALTVTNFGSISSNAFGSGKGGSVEVSSPVIAVTNGATIASDSLGIGDGGSVTVNANSLTVATALDGFSPGISTSALPGAAGNAGAITVNATTITLAAGGLIEFEHLLERQCRQHHHHRGDARDRRGRRRQSHRRLGQRRPRRVGECRRHRDHRHSDHFGQ